LKDELTLLEQIWIEELQPFGERGYNTIKIFAKYKKILQRAFLRKIFNFPPQSPARAQLCHPPALL